MWNWVCQADPYRNVIVVTPCKIPVRVRLSAPLHRSITKQLIQLYRVSYAH